MTFEDVPPRHEISRVDPGTVRRAFAHAPVLARIRLQGRLRGCPFDTVLERIPRQGRIVDVGCGDGLFLFLLEQQPGRDGRQCIGIDHDEHKIAVASRLGLRKTEFRTMSVADLPRSRFDCLTIVDVLYCVPSSRWNEFLGAAIGALKPGATLIMKEVVDTPRWKARLALLQEHLAINVLRMTRGSQPHFESADAYTAAIEASGGSLVFSERVGSRSYVSHYLFIGRRRA